MGMPNFESHTLFQGDCLAIMQGMNSETVDLIACDPPFNTAKDWTGEIKGSNRTAKFTDRWRWSPIHDEWMDSIESINPNLHTYIMSIKANEPSMAAFLCWLGVRCWEMHRILRNTGSLYLHLDHTAAAYAKVMLDCIFGRKNFRNEVIWKRNQGAKNQAHRFYSEHDTILYYVKNIKQFTWNPELKPISEDIADAWYRYTDQDGRRYCVGNLQSPMGVGYRYEFLGATRAWRYPKAKMDQLLKDGLIIHESTTPTSKRKVAGLKTYLADSKGAAPGDIWADIKLIGRKAKEDTGYPTQKPIALYERIVKTSSNPGDMVFDPFAGCATTLVAAEKHNRQWVGCDLWDGTKDILYQRVHDNRPVAAEPPKINHTMKPPVRDDNDGTAAPFLPELEYEQKKARFTKDQMKAILIQQWTAICWGCGFEPPKTNNRAQDADSRHFDLDQSTPRPRAVLMNWTIGPSCAGPAMGARGIG